MSVIPVAITGAILAAGQATMPGSLNLPRIATAVGNSVTAWLPFPTNVLSNGVTSGTAGAGVTTGKMVFVPAGQVTSSLLGVGLIGPTAPLLGQAVETGVSTVLNSSAQYIGTSIGVALGTDTTKVSLSNPGTLIAILTPNLAGVAIAGLTAPQLAVGLGTGIALLVQTGFGFGAVAPVTPGPAPAIGTSISTVF
jgi:hypothetical protein